MEGFSFDSLKRPATDDDYQLFTDNESEADCLSSIRIEQYSNLGPFTFLNTPSATSVVFYLFKKKTTNIAHSVLILFFFLNQPSP